MFTQILKFDDERIFAWDVDGRAWSINSQRIIGGHYDGGDYTAFGLDDAFQCRSCKAMGAPGSLCGCGELLPPAWVREEHLDHPVAAEPKMLTDRINALKYAVAIKDELLAQKTEEIRHLNEVLKKALKTGEEE